MEKRPGVTLEKYNTIDLALLDLKNGRVDAVASDGPVLRYMVRQSFPGLKTVGDEYTDEQFGVVFAASSDDLRRAVNAALWRLQDSGEYAKIYAKWFGELAEREHAAPARARAFDTSIIARTWTFFLRGAWLTAVMAATSLGLGLPLGLALALMRVQTNRLVTAPAAVYVEVMRGTPLLVQILFVYFVLPSVGINLPAFTSGVLALTLNAAAYISETIRAGILSIDAGQMEAARALGMSYWQSMRRIILPQTFRRVVPPLTNEGIALLEGFVAGVGHRPDRARENGPGARQPLRRAADHLADRRARLPRAHLPADASRRAPRAALAARHEVMRRPLQPPGRSHGERRVH